MGYSCSGYLVVGVKLLDLNPVRIERKNKVTRYNEITGVPYEVESLETYIKIGEVEFRGDLGTQVERFGEEPDEDTTWIGSAPDCFSYTYHRDLSDDELLTEVVLGFVLSKVSEDDIRLIDMQKMEKLKTQLEEWFLNNFKQKYNISTYLLLRESY